MTVAERFLSAMFQKEWKQFVDADKVLDTEYNVRNGITQTKEEYENAVKKVDRLRNVLVKKKDIVEDLTDGVANTMFADWKEGGNPEKLYELWITTLKRKVENKIQNYVQQHVDKNLPKKSKELDEKEIKDLQEIQKLYKKKVKEIENVQKVQKLNQDIEQRMEKMEKKKQK